MQYSSPWVKKHAGLIVLALILLLGLILRVYMLGKAPMWVDETISGVAADAILDHGVPRLDSGLFYGRALLYHYVEAAFLLFGHNDTNARLASVLFGLLTVVLAYLIGREFNEATGVVAALITSVLYLEVLYSRQARFYQLFQLLFFLTIYLMYKSHSRGWAGKKYAWLACLSLALCVQTHIAGVVLVPFVLLVFWMEFGTGFGTKKKDWDLRDVDWKIFIVPLLVGAYYGLKVLGVSFSFGSSGVGTDLVSRYAESYSSAIYNYLAGFLLLSLAGTWFAYTSNKRMFWLIVLPSACLFFGLFFVKVFALRYAYFVILAVVLLLANVFGYLYKHNKWLFAIALAFAIIYPSNLVFDANYFTVLLPEDVHTTSAGEPIIDYKYLNESTRTLILNNKIVVLSTPGVAWYLKTPEYAVPFSLNGLKTGYALYNGADAYTGAQVFESVEIFGNDKYVLLEDAFGSSKLGQTGRALINETRQNCLLVEQSYGLNVYSCG